MASPTFAEVWTQWKNTIDIVEELDKHANANTPNLLGQLDTLTQSLEGDYVLGVRGPLSELRARVSSLLEPGFLLRLFTPFVFELGRVIGAPESDVPSIMARLYDYMIDNSQTLNRREITYATPSADGGNTGNGTIRRLTVDDQGQPIESTHAEARTAECVRDGRQVEEGQEQFEFYGVEAEPDFLQVLGSGAAKKTVIRASDAIETEALLQNPSFSEHSGTPDSAGAITAIAGWTVGSDFANVDIDSGVTYRGFPGDPGPYSAKFTASDSLAQIITAALDPGRPYWMQAAVRPNASVTGGNVVLRMGAVSRTVALSSLNAGAWNIVTILSSPGQNCWLRNFNEADLDIKIEITGLTGSGAAVYVDDVLFVPWKRFNSLWYVITPAAASDTPWLRRDKFTFTDSISSDAVVQKWLWRAGLGYLPSTAGGTETITDP